MNIPSILEFMSRSTMGVVLGVMAVGLALIPSANALTSPPPPPEDFAGEYDNETQTVILSWEPPSGNADYSYNVYRDAELVDETDGTEFSEQVNFEEDVVASIYYVTAVFDSTGYEGPPGGLFFVTEGPICSPVIVGVDPWTMPPGVGGGVDHACLDMLKRSVDRLISDGPIGTIDLIDPEDLIWD